MTDYEFGVQYEGDDGSFVSPGWDEKAAAAFVRDHSARQWRPTPVRVVRRPVGEWEPA
jgi:hypothetical protein